LSLINKSLLHWGGWGNNHKQSNKKPTPSFQGKFTKQVRFILLSSSLWNKRLTCAYKRYMF